MPVFTPAELIRLLVGGLLLGLVFAAAYDALRILRILVGILLGCRDVTLNVLPLPPIRYSFSPPLWLCNFCVNFVDLLYLLAVGAVVAVYLAAESHSLLRWPFLVGLISGFGAWRLTLGRLVRAAAAVAAAWLHFALSWLLWALSRPFVGLGRLAANGIRRLICAAWLPVYTRRMQIRFRRQIVFAFSDQERGMNHET